MCLLQADLSLKVLSLSLHAAVNVSRFFLRILLLFYIIMRFFTCGTGILNSNAFFIMVFVYYRYQCCFYAYLLVTCRVVSRTPCRGVVDTSVGRCGLPSSSRPARWCCSAGFPPVYWWLRCALIWSLILFACLVLSDSPEQRVALRGSWLSSLVCFTGPNSLFKIKV